MLLGKITVAQTINSRGPAPAVKRNRETSSNSGGGKSPATKNTKNTKGKRVGRRRAILPPPHARNAEHCSIWAPASLESASEQQIFTRRAESALQRSRHPNSGWKPRMGRGRNRRLFVPGISANSLCGLVAFCVEVYRRDYAVSCSSCSSWPGFCPRANLQDPN
jgi:hypothetical protein